MIEAMSVSPHPDLIRKLAEHLASGTPVTVENHEGQHFTGVTVTVLWAYQASFSSPQGSQYTFNFNDIKALR